MEIFSRDSHDKRPFSPRDLSTVLLVYAIDVTVASASVLPCQLSVLHRCGRGSVTKAGLTVFADQGGRSESSFKCDTVVSDTRLLAPTLEVICCVCVFFFLT